MNDLRNRLKIICRLAVRVTVIPIILASLSAYPAEAAGEEASGKKNEITTIFPVPSPVYGMSDRSTLALVDPFKKYPCVAVRSDGYIVEYNGAKYFAPDDYFAPAAMVSGPINPKGPFEKSEFSAKSLPGEIEKSEFFFNTAAVKSFYSLAFILYLKSGKDEANYIETLKSFDEHIIKYGNEKKNEDGFLKVLSEFLKSRKIGNEYFGASAIGPKTLADALRFGKTVVFISESATRDGDVLVFFNSRGPSGEMISFDYYSHPGGIKKIGKNDAARFVASSVPGYLIID